jgi:hypothetical protein
MEKKLNLIEKVEFHRKKSSYNIRASNLQAIFHVSKSGNEITGTI